MLETSDGFFVPGSLGSARSVAVEEFLKLASAMPLLDARSPAEFQRGHIPGAFSFPLLDDAQRAAVGEAYAAGGLDAAFQKGLALAGGQLAGKYARAVEISAQTGGVRSFCLHCWRGGMRSASLAWLLEQGGFAVYLLEGGYRTYRRHVRAQLAAPRRVRVLAGMTGSGKTAVLRELASLGEQVVDLEALACHRGSAFGAIGQGEQPCLEQLENTLHAQWAAFDPARPIWIEDEDRRIGGISLSDEVFHHISTGSVVLLEVPRAARVRRLVAMYTELDMDSAVLRAELCASIRRLERRLGDEACRAAVDAVSRSDFFTAVDIVLNYYDALYRKALAKASRPTLLTYTAPDDNPRATALALKERAERLEKK